MGLPKDTDGGVVPTKGRNNGARAVFPLRSQFEPRMVKKWRLAISSPAHVISARLGVKLERYKEWEAGKRPDLGSPFADRVYGVLKRLYLEYHAKCVNELGGIAAIPQPRMMNKRERIAAKNAEVKALPVSLLDGEL